MIQCPNNTKGQTIHFRYHKPQCYRIMLSANKFCGVLSSNYTDSLYIMLFLHQQFHNSYSRNLFLTLTKNKPCLRVLDKLIKKTSEPYLNKNIKNSLSTSLVEKTK